MSPLLFDDRALTPWDSVSVRMGRFWTGRVSRRAQPGRLASQTEGVERLAADLAGDAAEAHRAEIEGLAADIAGRRRLWAYILRLEAQPVQAAAAPDGEESPVWARLREAPSNIAGGFLVAGLADFMLLALFGLIWNAIAASAAIGVAALASRPWQRRRLGRALARDECPKCSYDLSGSGVSLELEARIVVRLGPRKCSESGCTWPLVPALVQVPSDWARAADAGS